MPSRFDLTPPNLPHLGTLWVFLNGLLIPLFVWVLVYPKAEGSSAD